MPNREKLVADLVQCQDGFMSYSLFDIRLEEGRCHDPFAEVCMNCRLRDFGLRPGEPGLYQAILAVVEDGRLGQEGVTKGFVLELREPEENISILCPGWPRRQQ